LTVNPPDVHPDWQYRQQLSDEMIDNQGGWQIVWQGGVKAIQSWPVERL
jgi:hypothetical protein